MFRTANPTLNVFQTGNAGAVQQPVEWTRLAGARAESRPGVMTMGGTITASAILVGLTLTSAISSFYVISTNSSLGMPLGFGGMIIALIAGLVLFFAPRTAPFLAPVYAIAKGAFVGLISEVVANRLGPGMQALPFQALTLTIAVAGAMLAAYAFKIIRPGKVFYAVIISATLGYMAFAMLAFVLHLFGITMLSSLFSFTNNSPMAIGLSVVVVVLAAMNLVLDFDQIQVGVQTGQPKYMEWYAGYALLVTLIWLYIEILRLLSKLRR